MSDVKVDRLHDAAGTGAPDFPNGMPTVGGDPVVESGSNSDGEWTRWADGTQHCWITGATFLQVTATFLSYTWNFPVDFVDTAPQVGCASKPFVTGEYNGLTVTEVGAFCTGVSPGTGSKNMLLNSNGPAFAPGDTLSNCAIFMVGRWK